MNVKLKIRDSFWNIILKISFFFFPLLGVSFFRISILGNELPFFSIVLPIIGSTYFLYLVIIKKKILFEKSSVDVLILLIIFVLWHISNSFRVDSMELSIIENVKGIISIITLFFVILILNQERFRNLNFLSGAFWCSTIILIYLIYKYWFVFNSSYLGLNLDFKTEAGKNHLAFYIALIFPLVVANFFNKKSFFNFLILLVHSFALIYVDSKGALLSVVVSFLIIFINTRKNYIRKNLYFLSVLIFTVLFLILLGIFLFNIEVITNYYSHYVNIDIEALHSTKMRLSLILKALNYFFSKPLFGIGTAAFLDKVGFLTHNSYMQILCEQGLFGISIFGLFIYKIVKQIKIYKNNLYNLALTSSIYILFFYLIFINAYYSPIMYIIIGLFLSSNNKKTLIYSNEK